MQSGRSVVAPYMPPLPDRVRGRDARRPPLPRSHVLVLSDSSLVRLRDPAVLLKREPEKINVSSWRHSRPGELGRRIGTVPAISAWKTAAGPTEPGQGSRPERGRQSRLLGLDRVSAGPAYWLPRVYAFLRDRRSIKLGRTPPAIDVATSRATRLPFVNRPRQTLSIQKSPCQAKVPRLFFPVAKREYGQTGSESPANRTI